MAKYSEEEAALRKLDRKVSKALEEFRLIKDNDRILIGLSGGKDSLALVELLGRRMKIFKPRFSVIAAHISMSHMEYVSDTTYLEEITGKYNIPFIHRATTFDPEGDRRKSPCFLCSWYRRKTLFSIAKEYQCNKIALGHHQDDILQTLLMNMTFQGAFGTMPPKLSMSKFDMTLIRPMCLITEKELIALSDLQGYRKQKKNCPYESSSSRPDMKLVIEMLEKLNPQARNHLWASMGRIQEEYLPRSQKSEKDAIIQDI